jgi:mRNA interferase MazF
VKRGDFVIAREPGTDASKARPCLVIQSDDLIDSAVTITICPLTSTLRGTDLIRIPVSPDSANGLRKASEIAIDRVQFVPKSRIATVAGHASASLLNRVDDALRRWLDL